MANNFHVFSNGQQYQKIYNNGVVNESNVKYNMKYNPNTQNTHIAIGENNNGIKKHHYVRLNDNDIKQLFNTTRNNKTNLESNLKKLIHRKKKTSTKKRKQRKITNRKVKGKRKQRKKKNEAKTKNKKNKGKRKTKKQSVKPKTKHKLKNK